MKSVIKNLIFDFGGVLVDLDKGACVRAFERIGAQGVSQYVDECRQEDLFHDLEVGNTTPAEFCSEVRRITGCDASDEEISGAWNALLTGIPRERLMKLLALQQEYRLFLLSNTNAIHWERAIKDLFPMDGHGVNDYFEETYLSYELHLLKPSEEIFRHVMTDAGIKPNETIFIDDSAANCKAARELGIRTINAVGDEWMEII